MPNFGWRHGLTNPTERRSKEKPMGKNVLQQVAQGLDTMQVFQYGHCTSPDECDQPGIALSAILVGENIAIGLYCIDHLIPYTEPMLKIVRSTMRGGDDDGDVQ